MIEGLAMHPLAPHRWPDLEALFGSERGANSGCWCMWQRVGGALYRDMERGGRKEALQALVRQGPAPGLLAYHRDEAIGWCAIGPRQSFARFQAAKSSRLPEGAASAGIYAISCFFIRRDWRQRGVTRLLTLAALDFARQAGARALDVCAIEPDKPLQRGDGSVGIASVFAGLGFREIERRSPKRPLMRLELQPN